MFVAVGKKPLIKSKSQDVVVDDKITAIQLHIGSNLTLVAGSSVTILCDVGGVPYPTITWLQNGNQVLNRFNKTSLMVENPKNVNLQTVSCTSDNVLGFDTKTSFFKILGKNLLLSRPT